MTFQSERVLHLLRRAEVYKGGLIWIDYDSKAFSTAHEDGQLSVTVSHGLSDNELSQILDYLCNEKRIVRTGNFGEYLSLSHKVSHIWQHRFSVFCKSVFLPITVSLITTLIALRITT